MLYKTSKVQRASEICYDAYSGYSGPVSGSVPTLIFFISPKHRKKYLDSYVLLMGLYCVKPPESSTQYCLPFICLS